MEDKKIDHIELSDDEIKQAVGGKGSDGSPRVKTLQCLKSNGLDQNLVTYLCHFLGSPTAMVTYGLYDKIMSSDMDHPAEVWNIYSSCVSANYPKSMILNR